MKQLRQVWRSCTRDNVEADESYFVLNPTCPAMGASVRVTTWQQDRYITVTPLRNGFQPTTVTYCMLTVCPD